MMAKEDNTEEQQQKAVQKATGTQAEGNTVAEGEYAAKLKYDIDGGLGSHKAGTVLRNLSFSAFNTLTQGGGHEAIAPGKDAGADAVDVSQPIGG